MAFSASGVSADVDVDSYFIVAYARCCVGEKESFYDEGVTYMEFLTAVFEVLECFAFFVDFFCGFDRCDFDFFLFFVGVCQLEFFDWFAVCF